MNFNNDDPVSIPMFLLEALVSGVILTQLATDTKPKEEMLSLNKAVIYMVINYHEYSILFLVMHSLK